MSGASDKKSKEVTVHRDRPDAAPTAIQESELLQQLVDHYTLVRGEDRKMVKFDFTRVIEWARADERVRRLTLTSKQVEALRGCMVDKPNPEEEDPVPSAYNIDVLAGQWAVEVRGGSGADYKTVFASGMQSFTIAEYPADGDDHAREACEWFATQFRKAMQNLGAPPERRSPGEARPGNVTVCDYCLREERENCRGAPCANAMPATTWGFYVNDEDRKNAADVVERVTFYCKGLVVPDPERFVAEIAHMFGAIRSRPGRERAMPEQPGNPAKGKDST